MHWETTSHLRYTCKVCSSSTKPLKKRIPVDSGAIAGLPAWLLAVPRDCSPALALPNPPYLLGPDKLSTTRSVTAASLNTVMGLL